MRNYSDKFKEFLKNCEEGNYKSPREVPPSIFALSDWDFLPRREAEEIFLPFMRSQVERALKTMPDVYLSSYSQAGISP